MEKHKIDSEYFISIIKEYEPIWNKNTRDYHRKSRKEESWNQVCAEHLIHGWSDMSEGEKAGKQLDLKKRWNNIRDYYKKDLALQLNGSIGQPSMKRKRYMYSKQLDFLRPVFDQSHNHETTASDEETQEIYLEENYSSDSETYFLKRKQTIKLLEDSKILDESRKSEEVTTRSVEEEDSDLLFLKSLLPDMKMLNKSQKIDFKVGILKLYKRIMYESGDDEFEDSKNPLQ